MIPTDPIDLNLGLSITELHGPGRMYVEGGVRMLRSSLCTVDYLVHAPLSHDYLSSHDYLVHLYAIDSQRFAVGWMGGWVVGRAGGWVGVGGWVGGWASGWLRRLASIAPLFTVGNEVHSLIHSYQSPGCVHGRFA